MILPEVWLKKAACPVCARSDLRILHTDDAPDRMVCLECHSVFEVSEDSHYLRLAQIPDWLSSERSEVENVWIKPLELRAVLALARSENGGPPVRVEPYDGVETSFPEVHALGEHKEDFPARPPVRMSASETARKIQELEGQGATPDEIKRRLAPLGVDHHAVDTVLKVSPRKSIRFKPRASWIFAAVIILALAGSGVWLFYFGGLPWVKGLFQPVIVQIPASSTPEVGGTSPESMTPQEKVYFDVVWNLETDYLVKAGQLKEATPPAELAEINNEVISAYIQAGEAKKNYDSCESNNNQAGLNSLVSCTVLSLESSRRYNILRDLFSGRACETWKKFYQRLGESWPFSQGSCRYP